MKQLYHNEDGHSRAGIQLAGIIQTKVEEFIRAWPEYNALELAGLCQLAVTDAFRGVSLYRRLHSEK